ncbi:MAG: topoisomerase IV [Ruminococcaceae bacterium]|nr:topoisomerase IV [Oscillospiraceae bacterium]
MPPKKKDPKAPKRGAEEMIPAMIDEQGITETLTTNFMPYAISVIVSRAIPEIDGFKPSHRKLLYTMYKMNLLHGQRTKSANVVGQTMKLNPHGDQAIYDTLVRLARGNGALLHPLVDSKGNFGKCYSRDMAYAAPRYTEVKLEAITAELFRDIDQDAVDFVPNYDNTMQEPTLLPTAFPNVIVNANQGIAVGMASTLCSFNLAEVCRTTVELIRNPRHDILSTLTAPDFPTGGELIYNRAQLEQIYETGRGSFRVRARWRYEKQGNLIEIFEIPYTTTVEAIMDRTAELIKAGRVKEIADMRDETDLNGLKLTIDLKRGVDAERLMQKLFKLTPLEDSFSCNFNILIAGTPMVLGVRQILEEWTAWRTECIRRRVFFDLGKKKDRLHLLRGLSKILLDIDRAIAIIRETEEESEVIPNLMIGFGIDERQAEFVAEIRLRNINRQYILKRVDETSSLEKEIEELEALVASKAKLRNVIIRELNEIAKKYGEPRRTQIIEESETQDFEEEDAAPDYPVHVFLSREGYFKKVTPQSLRMSGEHKWKEGDALAQTFEARNAEEIIFLTNRAQAYKTRLSEFEDMKISALGKYVPNELGMDEGEVPVYAFLPGDYTGHLIYLFENGKAARVAAATFETKTNRRRLTSAYSDKSPLVGVYHIREDLEIGLFTSAGRLLLLNTAMLTPKTTRDTIGVAVMTLKPNQTVTATKPLAELTLADPKRYRSRTLPAAGMKLAAGDQFEQQLTLELL